MYRTHTYFYNPKPKKKPDVISSTLNSSKYKKLTRRTRIGIGQRNLSTSSFTIRKSYYSSLK